MLQVQQGIVRYFRLLLRIFFRRIEVTGFENVPEDRGGLIISWHPNGVIDAAVILTHFPRDVVFGARHGLFKWPVLGWAMHRLGMVPIYRRKDIKPGASDSERKNANRQSIDVLAQAIADGGFSALFPEGVSHDEPFVHELKSGAAYLYYRAVELTPEGKPPPVIIPVGLHYTKKRIFGSQVLVDYHRPLRVPEDLAVPAQDSEERKKQARRLTARFDEVLREVVMATENWDLHLLFQRGRKLIHAEGAARRGARSVPPSLSDRVRHFGSIWKGYQVGLETHPEETQQLVEGVAHYDEELRDLRIEDHELDGSAWVSSPRRAVLLFLEFLLVYLVLPPVLIFGVLVNLPTALALMAFTKAAASKYKDEASLKLIVGSVAFPLTWLLVAVLVGWGETVLAEAFPEIPRAPVLTGVVAFVLSAFGGVLALQYRQIATETLRTIRVHLTLARRKGAVRSLLDDRSRLFDQFVILDRDLRA